MRILMIFGVVCMALAPPSMSGAVTVAYDPRRVVVMGAPP